MSEEQQERIVRPDTAQLVKQIGDALGERKPGPLTLIRRIVKQFGAEVSLDYLRRTLEIEDAGGMQSAEGKRRTPGGIFFYLIKTERRKEETYPIFQLKPYTPGARPHTHPTPASPKPFTWQERQQALTQSQERTAVSVTIQLRGRPEAGSIIDTGTCIVLTMQNTKRPNIPKGVPIPPEEPVRYDVYVSYKLWRRVESASADEEDSLIIDGYPRIDTEHDSIAVIATGTSSKKLKAAEKAPKEAG